MQRLDMLMAFLMSMLMLQLPKAFGSHHKLPPPTFLNNFDPIPKVVKMNNSILSQWYDPLAICMMHQTGNRSFFEYLPICKNITGGQSKYPEAFFTLPSSAFARKVRGACCPEDLPLSERGFDEALEGYEDPNATPALKTLQMLSASNRSLLFLGDSMNNQVFTAFVEEFDREYPNATIQRGNIDSRWWATPDGIARMNINRKSVASFGAMFTWDPPKNMTFEGIELSNRVYIYAVSLWYFNNNYEERLTADVIIPMLNEHEHPSGLVVLANIGHHLGSERSHPNRMYMNERMAYFLTWLQRLMMRNPGSIGAFRETTPSHFNSPDLDGSFEKWTSSANSKYDYKKPNSWDHTMNHCRAIYNISNPLASQVLENLVVREILTNWQNESIVEVLPVYKYLAPFGNLKYGHCGGYSRIEVIDCVHFCANQPVMWMPIWTELERMIRRHPTKNTKNINNHDNNSSISSNNYTGRTVSDKPFAFQLLKTNDTNPCKYYIYETGIVRYLPTLYSLNKSRGIVVQDHDALSLSLQEIRRYPEALPIPEALMFADGTIVKINDRRAKEFFYIKEGIRHSIPNWDTFVAMKLDASKAVLLSAEQMESIPLGDMLPKIDGRRALKGRHET